MLKNVDTLEGLALDYAVARAKGWSLFKDNLLCGVLMEGWHISGMYKDPNIWVPLSVFNPSENWAQGGPILEENGIDLNQLHEGWSAGPNAWTKALADKPLIAIMRAFVKLKFGEKIDLPEDVCDSENVWSGKGVFEG